MVAAAVVSPLDCYSDSIDPTKTGDFLVINALIFKFALPSVTIKLILLLISQALI
jgi:hypothetical protein